MSLDTPSSGRLQTEKKSPHLSRRVFLGIVGTAALTAGAAYVLFERGEELEDEDVDLSDATGSLRLQAQSNVSQPGRTREMRELERATPFASLDDGTQLRGLHLLFKASMDGKDPEPVVIHLPEGQGLSVWVNGQPFTCTAQGIDCISPDVIAQWRPTKEKKRIMVNCGVLGVVRIKASDLANSALTLSQHTDDREVEVPITYHYSPPIPFRQGSELSRYIAMKRLKE